MKLVTYALSILVFMLTGPIALLAEPPTSFPPVTCAGSYAKHLQGVCTDDKDALFWSFTTQLVKTDRQGVVQKQVDVANHHGDLCHHAGKLFVAVNLGQFNKPEGQADSWVYVYDAADLSFLGKHAVPDVVHGAGGIVIVDGKFFVVGGLPEGVQENYVYEYGPDYKLVKKHVLASGYTLMGIQTATFADGHWWFGCYGEPQILLKADREFKTIERFEFDCSLGIFPIANNRFLVATGVRTPDKGYSGRLETFAVDEQRGLARVDQAPAAK